jgi:hypothetical protein
MDEPTWAEVLSEILDERAGAIHTAMPGLVRRYDHTSQTAHIEPQLRVDGAELPVIPDVPVVWPLTYRDLAVGETVLLVFCESDIGLWRQQGEAGEPQDSGRHGLHGAVAIAGLARASAMKTFTAGSTVLPGTDLRLGAATAAQGVLQGTAYQAAMGIMLTAVQSALNSAGVDPALVLAAPLAAGFLVTAASAIGASGLTSATAHVSTQVKVP